MRIITEVHCPYSSAGTYIQCVTRILNRCEEQFILKAKVEDMVLKVWKLSVDATIPSFHSLTKPIPLSLISLRHHLYFETELIGSLHRHSEICIYHHCRLRER